MLAPCCASHRGHRAAATLKHTTLLPSERGRDSHRGHRAAATLKQEQAGGTGISLARVTAAIAPRPH